MFKSAVLLDAGMSAQEVAEHLGSYSADAAVVIRRAVGVRLLWYLFEHSQVNAWISRAPAAAKLSGLLRFEEPSPTLPVESVRHAKVLMPTILLDGTTFAGVKWDDPLAYSTSEPASAAAPVPTPATGLPRQHSAQEPAVAQPPVKKPHRSAGSTPPGLVSPAQPRLVDLGKPPLSSGHSPSDAANQPRGWWQAVREAWRQRPSGGAHPPVLHPLAQVVQVSTQHQATQNQTHTLVTANSAWRARLGWCRRFILPVTERRSRRSSTCKKERPFIPISSNRWTGPGRPAPFFSSTPVRSDTTAICWGNAEASPGVRSAPVSPASLRRSGRLKMMWPKASLCSSTKRCSTRINPTLRAWARCCGSSLALSAG